MTVHDLFVALSQCDRTAKVTIKAGKLYIGGKPLGATPEPDASSESESGTGDETGEPGEGHA